MKISISYLLAYFVLLGFSHAEENTSAKLNLDDKNVILHGYDAVSYFNGKALKGKKNLAATYRGARYLFSDQQHLSEFQKNPERYLPQNGGYCTFGVLLKKKFDVDPSVWLVQNDKLFLFLNSEVREKFKSNLKNNLKKVNKNWPGIERVPASNL